VAELYRDVALVHAARREPRAREVAQGVKRAGEDASAHPAERRTDAPAVERSVLVVDKYVAAWGRVARERSLYRGRRLAEQRHAALLAALLAQDGAAIVEVDVLAFEAADAHRPGAGVGGEQQQVAKLEEPAAQLAAAQQHVLELRRRRDGSWRLSAAGEFDDLPHVEGRHAHEHRL